MRAGDYTALVAGATAAVMDGFPELQGMTDYTLLPAYVAAPGFDAYKTALKVRSGCTRRILSMRARWTLCNAQSCAAAAPSRDKCISCSA